MIASILTDPGEWNRQQEARLLVQNTYEWEKWRLEMPYIPIQPGWSIKPIPPFGGAVARFLVRCGEAEVSIYLDCYDQLGCERQPYWEVYPIDDDVARCYLHEVNDLVRLIQTSISGQLSENA